MNSTDRDKAKARKIQLPFPCGCLDGHSGGGVTVDEYTCEPHRIIATALAEVRKEAEAPYAMCRQVQKRGEHSSTMCACVLAVEESIRAEARRETWEAAIDRINKQLGRYVMVRGPEVDVMRTVCNQIIGEFESAREKDEH